MGKALYRKHRPKKLDDIIGQEHITATLAKAIKSGRVSHAYLLTGPRGTGKTSIARILAHGVNKLPYDDESIHLDIIEIDAASNRRIDEIRELKDRVNIAPTSAKYKVYIIDEVHMLTREAFNALLKTLEEPPEHAIFILATTEAHKLPDTIISRTQRFSLKPIELGKVVEQLKHIAEQEGLIIDDDALEIIAQHGNGSFRDSISLLDQVGNASEHVTKSDVQQALGLAPHAVLETLISAITTGDAGAIANTLKQANDQGIQPAQFAEQLSDELRQLLIRDALADRATQSVDLIKELLSVPSAHNPQIALELALYGTLVRTTPSPAKPTPSAQAKTTAPVTQKPTESVAVNATPKQTTAQEPKASPAVRIQTDPTDTTDAPTDGDWKDILDAVKAKHNTLYGIARMATPKFSPGKITLVFNFPFHQKRVSDAKNHEILSSIAQDITGQKLALVYQLEKITATQPAQTQQAKVQNADLSSITEIFGDAEVLD